jgi:hypothetical protein
MITNDIFIICTNSYTIMILACFHICEEHAEDNTYVNLPLLVWEGTLGSDI